MEARPSLPPNWPAAQPLLLFCGNRSVQASVGMSARASIVARMGGRACCRSRGGESPEASSPPSSPPAIQPLCFSGAGIISGRWQEEKTTGQLTDTCRLSERSQRRSRYGQCR